MNSDNGINVSVNDFVVKAVAVALNVSDIINFNNVCILILVL